jgi:serine/threonine protein kinase
LLDWGVAKVWGHTDDDASVRKSVLRPQSDAEEKQLQTLTGGGQRPGTPLYMSPEQVDGNRGIDERTDVFSVGVCLYEMLALCEPFRGANIDETFDNIKRKEVPPPSERAPERGIPKGADEVVMRAIQKRPGDRYQSMRELIADIRKIEQLG